MKKYPADVISLALAVVIGLAAGCGAGKPVVKSADPKKGFAGTGFRVTGTGFGAKRDKSTLRLGSKAVKATSWSDTSVTARIPWGTAEGSYDITLKTAGGLSNRVSFEVQPGFTASTPLPAMMNYLKSIGVDTGAMSYSVVAASAEDPTWKLDKATSPSEGTHYFLVHQDEEGWSIVDYGTSITAARLKADGAPGDIPPAP